MPSGRRGRRRRPEIYRPDGDRPEETIGHNYRRLPAVRDTRKDAEIELPDFMPVVNDGVTGLPGETRETRPLWQRGRRTEPSGGSRVNAPTANPTFWRLLTTD